MKEAVIVTGVGKGIGKEILNYFIEKNIYVYGVTRSSSDIKKLSKNKKYKIYISDIRNTNIFFEILKDSKINNMVVNGLVNNAGIRQRIPFNKINENDLKEIFEINFFSIFKIMQLFSQFCMKNKIKSSIVNIGSIVGSIGFPELCGYSSTKGALNSLTRSFAVEFAKYKIRANIIEPGFVKTSYYENFKKKSLYQWTLSRIPMKRWGDGKEIAKLAYFLYSSDSSYINGETITIDGGWKNS